MNQKVMKNSIILYAMNINELSTLEVNSWCDSFISDRTKEKVKRLRLINDKKRTLCGELLVRYAIKLERQISNNQIVVRERENGKPYCLNHSEIHFNISHSGDYVVCVVDSHPIGVDIEKIGVTNMQIAKRFFTEYEYQYLQRQENKVEIFYKLWTLKESYIKCTGKGLTVPLNSFEFEITDEIIELKIPKTNEFYFKSKKVFGNYYLSLCCEEQHKSMNIKQITYKEIKDRLV